jgi:hypothetical protein
MSVRKMDTPPFIKHSSKMPPHTLMLAAIQEQKEKEKKCDIWENSPYKDVATLESNNVGNVGEKLVETLCKEAGIPAKCDGSKTKQVGGGAGDGEILGKSVEVKTARQGAGSTTFQHELGEVPWKANAMVFIDISPDCYYLTVFKNFDEETYKSGKKLPYAYTSKSVTWRKKIGAFKLDTSIQLNTKNIENDYTIRIDSSTSIEDIDAFIRKQLDF